MGVVGIAVMRIFLLIARKKDTLKVAGTVTGYPDFSR